MGQILECPLSTMKEIFFDVYMLYVYSCFLSISTYVCWFRNIKYHIFVHYFG